MDDSNSTDRRELATAQHSTLPTIGSTVDERTRRAEFAKVLSPALILVAPTGMSGDERKAWLAAADLALSDYDQEAIAVGARIAMLNADHPRQLVPMIAQAAEKEIGRRESQAHWDAINARIAEKRTLPPPPPVKHISEEERADVAKLMSGLSRKLSANVS